MGFYSQRKATLKGGRAYYFPHPGARLSSAELQPQRLEGETFADYRKRRAYANHMTRHL